MPEPDSLKFLSSPLRSRRRETKRPQLDFECDKFTFRSRLTEQAVRLALCLAMCLLLAALAQAQTETTGSFHGSVSNKRGAHVLGATLEITDVARGVQR